MASLKAEQNIKTFAHLMIVKFSKLNIVPDLENRLGEYMSDDIYRAIFDCISLMLENYKDITAKISITEFEDKDYVLSKQKYMEQLLARCLKLSEGQLTFFEFLLVCVYLCKFSECIYARYRCCKVLKVTADCLEAVYCRKYCTFFQEHGRFLGFADFCRTLTNCEHTVEYMDGDHIIVFPGIVDRERNGKVRNLGCIDILNTIFHLNPFEHTLLNRWSYSKSPRPDASEDYLIKTRQVLGAVQSTGSETLCDYCQTICLEYSENILTDFMLNAKVRVNATEQGDNSLV